MYITVMKCCAGLKGSDTKDGTKNKINLEEDVFISIISDPIVENRTFWQQMVTKYFISRHISIPAMLITTLKFNCLSVNIQS